MQSERLDSGVEARFPSLSPLRGEQALPLGPGLDALRVVWSALERGDAGGPPENIRPAGRPGQPPLRVRAPGDAAPARRGVLVPGLRLGDAPDRRPTDRSVDGCFGKPGSFVDNPNLARWENPRDRLAYYRGHRDGNEARSANGDPGPDGCDEIPRQRGVPMQAAREGRERP
jgi:hypothetical protein